MSWQILSLTNLKDDKKKGETEKKKKQGLGGKKEIVAGKEEERGDRKIRDGMEKRKVVKDSDFLFSPVFFPSCSFFSFFSPFSALLMFPNVCQILTFFFSNFRFSTSYFFTVGSVFTFHSSRFTLPFSFDSCMDPFSLLFLFSLIPATCFLWS